ncbi:Hypothetical protein Tpal_1806 [Trichococcus palustris]|jgi:hypothetical protein|uniref:Uncharacterized protein n=1 Tax=Trichococcus palustris TaxID=140314 RepID=A0A143YNU7_9LACT|nr:hypothetical protein [Trichococcus palustris]CZQ94860.1 Hypothetical protein Tpal_1806 [Trichococcus palustris]SFK92170.1 hypothetical protein SAMN04488076_10947 [Trichococcus palustris]
MSNPKKPLITRERYREYQKEQTKKSASPSKAGTEIIKGKVDAIKTPLGSTGKEPISRKKENPGTQSNGNNASRKSQTAVKKEPKKSDKKTKDLRLTSKEKGRQLDIFLNKAIVFVILLIILVFVIAFIL